MKSESLIEKLGLNLIPGGFCQWGPTLLASDLLLGGSHPKGVSDQSLLSGLSIALRDRQCSRLVILGRLLAKSADPDGDLPGLLVPWRSEILDAEVIWVFSEPLPAWSGILDFLEIRPAPSGSMLGEAELLSNPKAIVEFRQPTFIGGTVPKEAEANTRDTLAGWTSGDCLILPSLGGRPKLAALAQSVELKQAAWPPAPASSGGA